MATKALTAFLINSWKINLNTLRMTHEKWLDLQETMLKKEIKERYPNGFFSFAEQEIENHIAELTKEEKEVIE